MNVWVIDQSFSNLCLGLRVFLIFTFGVITHARLPLADRSSHSKPMLFTTNDYCWSSIGNSLYFLFVQSAIKSKLISCSKLRFGRLYEPRESDDFKSSSATSLPVFACLIRWSFWLRMQEQFCFFLFRSRKCSSLLYGTVRRSATRVLLLRWQVRGHRRVHW